MGNPGPVVLEQQQPQVMHPSFPGFAPPGAAPTQAPQGPPSAQQARAQDPAPAAAAPGSQQMHVPTFVVNAGQPNEVRAISWLCRLGAGPILQIFKICLLADPLSVTAHARRPQARLMC